jgi:ArsR family transcriptional regulator
MRKDSTIIPLTDARADPACCAPAPLHTDAQAAADEVKLLAALADTTRLQIIEMLSGLDEPLCVCEILSYFDLSQPTISHHLKVLRDSNLVAWEKRGLWVYYSLNRDTFNRASAYLSNLLPSLVPA